MKSSLPQSLRRGKRFHQRFPKVVIQVFPVTVDWLGIAYTDRFRLNWSVYAMPKVLQNHMGTQL